MPPAEPEQPPEGRRNQRVERLVHEDEGARIEELRYAGQTQSITVQPKAEVPAYEVAPATPSRNRIADERQSTYGGGQRFWNVFRFVARIPMAVFTEVPEDEARKLAQRLGLGELVDPARHPRRHREHQLLPLHRAGRPAHLVVLTLFERLSFEQLPFYLHLMKHLAHRGIPVPDPEGDRDGDILHTLSDKPPPW